MPPADDRWVSVRTLGEFVFCPRAGLLAADAGPMEEELPAERINLDFLPQYSLAVIEEQLAIRLKKLGLECGRMAGALLLLGLVLWFGVKLAVLLAAVGSCFFAWRACRQFRLVLVLQDWRQQALAAQPNEPPIGLTARVRTNWWDLLRAGFDPVICQESLRDEDNALAGKPWRVLRRGSLRIPVIKLETDNFKGGRFWVYPQHEIRLAAYAHLLAVSEGGMTPYGVVLFGDSYDGVAIPLPESLRPALFRRLDLLRLQLRLVRTGTEPPGPPRNPALCSQCPWGKPVVVTAEERLRPDPVVPLRGVTGLDGKQYHSDCGDGFGWTPPHRQARQKGLLPPGE